MMNSIRCFALAFICVLQPLTAEGTDLLLTQEDLVRIGPLGWIAPELQIPSVPLNLPVVRNDKTISGAVFLNELAAQTEISGLGGIVYDNHDRGHSMLPRDLFPGLVYLQYAPELKKQTLDNGPGGHITLPVIVIGNSSTVRREGTIQRSHMRVAMSTEFEAARAYFQYTNNHLYIYPEHRDHDAADLYPANWAYMVTSQGSSGSDQPFIKALIMTVAALPKDTRNFLKENNLIAPTLQMILRRTQRYISNRDQYLSGAAHPTVFASEKLMPDRMIALANALKPDEVPPLVKLEVTEETFSRAAGLGQLSERLYDTPSAIARVWRSLDYSQEMVVSAARTTDPNGHPLGFDWVVLRGDPQRVRIVKLDSNGAKARIEVDWHDERIFFSEGRRLTSRVDIGVFASNGFHDSAPALISITFPTHQVRVYSDDGPNEGKAIKSVDYSKNLSTGYVDPAIYWVADWRDEFGYDDLGQLNQWTRVLPVRSIEYNVGQNPGLATPPEYRTDVSQQPLQLYMK
jgi:hypothetical protein